MSDDATPIDFSKSFANVYMAELFLEEPPALDPRTLHTAMKTHCGNVELMGGDKEGMAMYAHSDHQAIFKDGSVPVQFTVLAMDKEKAPTSEDLAASLWQTWTWDAAADVVKACPHHLIANDLMASSLPYRERMELFRKSLRAVVETYPVKAIHFRQIQQFMHPEQFLASFDEADPDPLCGILNVRFFKVEGTEQMVMDTLGLCAIGLSDLQVHFEDLDPNDVARFLWNLAFYAYENGDIIEDGHTVQGVGTDSKWVCQHEASLIGPDRIVLDINPGRDEDEA